VLVVLVLLGLGLLVALRYVILMLFLGIVVATALTPVVDRLRKLGLAQGTATLIAFGALLLIIGGIVAALAPFFVTQFVQALTDLPKFYDGFRTTVSSSDSQFLRGLGAQLPADLFSGLVGENGIALGSQATLLLPALVSTLLFSALVMILSYYWLYYRALAIQSIALLAPINQRAGALELWNDIETKIGAFVRGLAILGFVIGLLSAIGYTAIGLPYGLTIAIIAGILEAIPYVGPLITLVLAGMVGLSVSQPMALLAIGIAMVIQFLENSIVVPRVMDRAVGVSPVVTLLALAVFSDLFGLLGALLAVPLAAVFQVLVDRMMLRAVSPADLEIGGRDKLALLRYQTQDIASDLRQQVRAKTEDMDAEVDAAEEELEALLLDLDSLLAAAQEQRA
jgi:predicted PurR-regulated permease PerM